MTSFSCVHKNRHRRRKAFAVLFASFAWCQETLEDETSVAERKEKRGISLNLGGQGFEGYSYLGPSPSSRGLNYQRGGYTPITEYGTDR